MACKIISLGLSFPLGKIWCLLVQTVPGLPFCKSNYSVTKIRKVYEEHASDVDLLYVFRCIHTCMPSFKLQLNPKYQSGVASR